ncbi:CD3072 family TudS-related putative desulfidase [Desulfocucumis palustris]|uniref:CD3072 family TudS-related putative desulfidase n=1 Tax=Desulfocucumis palustris TaxID=1898651 RepID=UPI0035A23630
MSHCILNSNSKVEGLSNSPGIISEVMNLLMEKQIGIIQLPCPEMVVYGIKRWGHVREQFDTLFFREKCQDIIKPITYQLLDYVKNGYKVIGIIGVDGSPSCGVNLTCSGDWGGEFLGNIDVLNKVTQLSQVES